MADPIPLPTARAWCRQLVATIEPVCERVVVVGSVRRQREYVGDLELLVEPTMVEGQGDLFAGGMQPDIEAVTDAILESDSGRHVIKGGSRYVQVSLGGSHRLQDDRPKLDLFFCHPPASWGALMVIRTGPSSLSRALVTRLREKGWRNHRGAVWKPAPGPPGAVDTGGELITRIDGEEYLRVPTPHETAYFEACDLVYHHPARRDELAARLQAAKEAHDG